MTPLEATTRFRLLGATIDVGDLPHVERLNIHLQPTAAEHVDVIASLQPQSVELNGSLMTERDIAATLHFSSLNSIVAHQIDFAPVLLKHSAAFPRLKSIAMAQTPVTDADVETLADRHKLTYVNFARTQLTDVALGTFATLSGLEILNLRETQVTDDGLQHLHNLRNLFTINVRGTAITAAGAGRYRKQVAEVLPDVEVLVWQINEKNDPLEYVNSTFPWFDCADDLWVLTPSEMRTVLHANFSPSMQPTHSLILLEHDSSTVTYVSSGLLGNRQNDRKKFLFQPSSMWRWFEVSLFVEKIVRTSAPQSCGLLS